jgi:hypothetical protein
VIELGRQNGIDTLFMLTEPREVSTLSKLGVKCEFIGGAIEHRGQRVPSRVSTGRMAKDVNFLVRSFYRTCAAEIAQGR